MDSFSAGITLNNTVWAVIGFDGYFVFGGWMAEKKTEMKRV